MTLDLWLTLISEPNGGAYSTNRRLLRADGTLAVLAEHGEFFDRSQVIDAFDVISETINSDHELGLDMYFGDRIVQTLSMLDEGLSHRLGPAGIERVWEVIDESLDELAAFFDARGSEGPPGAVQQTGEAGHHLQHRQFVQQGVRADV